MIHSAEEFVALRSSPSKSDYDRATHDPASDDVWLDVIERFPEMKVWVAHNKAVSLAILHALSEDDDPAVRRSVAMKRRCPPEVLVRLTGDRDESVRNAVALNPQATDEVLRILARDEWVVCSENAKRRLQSS